MKHTITHYKKIFIIASILLLSLSFSSCYIPSPLYGTWEDNSGSKLVFLQDNTFNGSIKNTDGETIQYAGNYSVIDNVLVFLFKEPETYSINTEWDLRGAIMTLQWTDTKNAIENKTLTLYHTAK